MKTNPLYFILLLTLLLIAGAAGFILETAPGQAAPGAGPVLSVPASTLAEPNSTVSIPVSFTSNGNTISSIVFSIDYDQAYLAYDNTVPSAWSFNLPANFNGSCIPDTGDPDGELDCFIIYLTVPLQPLPDGVLGTIKLKTANPPTAVNAAVNFSTSSPVYSFGDTSGQSVPGSAVNGVVVISSSPIPSQADLMLDKTASSAQVYASTVFTYTLTVTNNGPDPSGTLTLTDTLPAGVSLLKASSTGFSSCAISGTGGRNLTCTGDSLANGGTATINFRVNAPSTPGTLTNKAGVHGVAADLNLLNNFDQAVTTINPWADLAVSTSCLPDSSNALLLNCTVKVNNLGPSAASTLVLTHTWSGSMGPYQNINGGSCLASGVNLACNFTSLALAGSLQVTFQALAPAMPWPCSTATISAATPDIYLPNNTSTSCTSRVLLPMVMKDYQGVQPSISGVIKDGSSNPIAGVTVSDGAGHSTVTDAAGAYSFQNLTAGTYTITPTKTCYSFAPNQRQVVVAGSVGGVDFTGTAGCTISGKVTKSGGAAVPGVTVSAGAGNPGVTDASGNYTITGLAAGSYSVTPNKACYTFSSALVNVAAPATGINFTGASSCSISGVITKAGTLTPLAGVAVSDGAGHTSITNAQGAYALTGLEAGSTTITPTRGCYAFVPVNRTITVSGQHTDQNFSGTANCAISGKVTNESNVPLPGVTMSIGGGYATTTTLADGSYSFSSLADGSYTVTPFLANTIFSPSSSTVSLPPSITSVNFTVAVQAGCYGGVLNGGFENNSMWVFPPTDHSAGYSQAGDPTKAGSRSLRTGILSAADQVMAFSSAYQSVSIPADATKVNLAFWMYPQTTEQPLSPASALMLNPLAPDAVDTQYVLIQDKIGNNYFLMSIRSNSRSWSQLKFDLLQVVGQFIKGQTIKIWFGTYNDGADGVTAMFVDEVTLEICQP